MSSHTHEYKDPLKQYLLVFVSLLVLLLATVGAYHIDCEKIHLFGFDWGFLNTVIALTIAAIKSAMVMLVFMHLRHATKLTWIIAVAGFLWLCIMITFTFSDYLTRSSIHEMVSTPVASTDTDIVAARGAIAEHQSPIP